MPLDAAAGRLEAELPAVAAAGAQLEARGPQPVDGEVLERVARGEDAQRLAGEGLVRILRRVRIFVGKAPGTGLADPAGAEIVARRLQAVTREERLVDMGIDGGGQAGLPLRSERRTRD